jgi:hypothetical protein
MGKKAQLTPEIDSFCSEYEKITGGENPGKIKGEFFDIF